jgi:hypothetical protein
MVRSFRPVWLKVLFPSLFNKALLPDALFADMGEWHNSSCSWNL